MPAGSAKLPTFEARDRAELGVLGERRGLFGFSVESGPPDRMLIQSVPRFFAWSGVQSCRTEQLCRWIAAVDGVDVLFYEMVLAWGGELVWRGKVTGEASPSQLAAAIGACDDMMQSYPDGVSSRRLTAMAALALGMT